VAGFLGSRPPFDAVSADELARVAAVTRTEDSPRGTTIFSQGAGPVEDLRMVRSGSVEVVHDGRVLDLLGPGELFGQASMISGLPTGFEARAGEDTVCYRIPADVVHPLLAHPDVLAFVARSIVIRSAAPAVTPPENDLIGWLGYTVPASVTEGVKRAAGAGAHRTSPSRAAASSGSSAARRS